jgi:hypothetical protein
MTSVWYQAEFYSKLDQRWVALGGRTEAGARKTFELLVGDCQRRIVKVTQTVEVVNEDADAVKE